MRLMKRIMPIMLLRLTNGDILRTSQIENTSEIESLDNVYYFIIRMLYRVSILFPYLSDPIWNHYGRFLILGSQIL